MVSPQVFFLGDKFVDGTMAFATHRNGLLHLLSGEPLFEPLVGVTSAWNEMMLGRSALRDTTAKGTGLNWGHARDKCL